MPLPTFPRFTPVSDHAVLVEFSESLTPEVQDRVRDLDAALALHPLTGLLEAVPGHVALLVRFEPLVTDHATVAAGLRQLLETPPPVRGPGRMHQVPVCYDADLAPDLAEIALRCGMETDAVIAAHLAAEYRVAIYGFAPGYAYLSGVPEGLHLPRKTSARRGVAAGSVIIAGGQCLITTLTMPTGWWILGQSPLRVLQDDPDRPFLFDIGDRVQFHRISRGAFDRGAA